MRPCPLICGKGSAELTWREAECKLSLEVTFLALQVFVGDNHHHPTAPRGEWAGYSTVVTHPGTALEDPTVLGQTGASQEDPSMEIPGKALHTHPLALQPHSQPLLNEFTGDGPDTGARQDVTVRHTQLQPIVCLFQLPDHLVDKLNIAGAVADEGIKTLRLLPWVQNIMGMVRALQEGWGEPSQVPPA